MTEPKKFTQEWYNELMWKSLPQWRKDQLIYEREQEEKQTRLDEIKLKINGQNN